MIVNFIGGKWDGKTKDFQELKTIYRVAILDRRRFKFTSINSTLPLDCFSEELYVLTTKDNEFNYIESELYELDRQVGLGLGDLVEFIKG